VVMCKTKYSYYPY